MCLFGGWAVFSLHPNCPSWYPKDMQLPLCTYTHTHTNTSFNYWFIGWGKVPAQGEDWSYRISNGPGMKRFLIFRLAAFQWTGVLNGAQALIPAPGSIIGVSCRSPWPPPKCSYWGRRRPKCLAAFFCTSFGENDQMETNIFILSAGRIISDTVISFFMERSSTGWKDNNSFVLWVSTLTL